MKVTFELRICNNGCSIYLITMAARSMARAVFDRSNAGILGSNFAGRMSPYLHAVLFCIHVVLT